MAWKFCRKKTIIKTIIKYGDSELMVLATEEN